MMGGGVDVSIGGGSGGVVVCSPVARGVHQQEECVRMCVCGNVCVIL